VPCVFCICVGFALAGAVGAAAVDALRARLEPRATGPVRTVADSESVAKVELEVEAAGQQVPVAVTLFKDSGRVRIQLLNHGLGRKRRPQPGIREYRAVCVACRSLHPRGRRPALVAGICAWSPARLSSSRSRGYRRCHPLLCAPRGRADPAPEYGRPLLARSPAGPGAGRTLLYSEAPVLC
jgi:hypothetical protein